MGGRLGLPLSRSRPWLRGALCVLGCLRALLLLPPPPLPPSTPSPPPPHHPRLPSPGPALHPPSAPTRPDLHPPLIIIIIAPANPRRFLSTTASAVISKARAAIPNAYFDSSRLKMLIDKLEVG